MDVPRERGALQAPCLVPACFLCLEPHGRDQQFARPLRAETTDSGSGLEGVTVVDAWDSAGVREERFVEPIGISMALEVRHTGVCLRIPLASGG